MFLYKFKCIINLSLIIIWLDSFSNLYLNCIGFSINGGSMLTVGGGHIVLVASVQSDVYLSIADAKSPWQVARLSSMSK